MQTLTPPQLVEIFMAMRPKIERIIAARVGDRATAADLTQDLFLRLGRVSDRLADDGAARRYLARMAVNASIDHAKLEARRVELLAGLVDLLDNPVRTPEDDALTEDRLGSVDRALDELPAKCREMLFLSRVQGLTHAEIAERMGVSKALVEKYVARALLHCRARLLAEE